MTQFAVLAKMGDDQHKSVACDAYGFVKSPTVGSRPLHSTEERDRSWFTFLSRLGMDDLASKIVELKTDEGRKADRDEFSRLVKLGIPVAFRQQIWLALACHGVVPFSPSSSSSSGDGGGGGGGGGVEILGTPALAPWRSLSFESLVSLSSRSLPPSVKKGIENDLDRTFPGHSMFSPRSRGLADLNSVLLAFSHTQSAVGYCQGLNQYAAQLLQFLGPRDSLGVLAHIAGAVMPEGYFDETMRGRVVDGLVIEHLIRSEMPRVHDKFNALGFEVGVATGAWFSQCFTGCLGEMELVFRVFDQLLWFGNKTVFKLAMRIVGKNEGRILEAGSATELYGLFVQMALEVDDADVREAAEYRLRTGAITKIKERIMGGKVDALEVEVERLR